MVHEYDLSTYHGHITILEEGDEKIQSGPKRVKRKRKDNVLKFRLDPEMLRGKSGDELNEVIEREKARLEDAQDTEE